MPSYEDKVLKNVGELAVVKDALLVTEGSATSVLGFFGASGATKTAVGTVGATDGTTLQTGLNSVIAALRSYGLL